MVDAARRSAHLLHGLVPLEVVPNDRVRRPAIRNESLTLLRGGRLLVVKQRDPVQFIEFGPASAVAHGFGPDTYLRTDERFESQPGRARRGSSGP